MKRRNKFPFSSYEEFERNMMALESGEEKPIFEILNVDPKNYPAPDSLSKRKVNRKFRKLKRKLERNSFALEFSERIPVLEAYRYLVCTLLYEKDNIHLAKGYISHITGCCGDCPDCFQLDYCDVKCELWTDEEIKNEKERRRRKIFQSEL
jgi:hypothetical protein